MAIAVSSKPSQLLQRTITRRPRTGKRHTSAVLCAKPMPCEPLMKACAKAKNGIKDSVSSCMIRHA
eukprot:scaffold2753_cov65-Phaeocystis_antarctica.AAC.2